jgi:hypothetical protein
LDPKDVPGAPNDVVISSSLKEGGNSSVGICSKRMEVGAGSEPIIGARGSGTLCEYLDCEIVFEELGGVLPLNIPGIFIASDTVLVIGIGGDLSGPGRLRFSPDDVNPDIIY